MQEKDSDSINSNKNDTEFLKYSLENMRNSVLNSKDRWTGFLRSSAYLYKYDFESQLSLYTLSPKARSDSENKDVILANLRACASKEQWQRLGANINENAKGIPILKNDGSLSYVYDVSDTDSDIKIWQPYDTSEFYSVLSKHMNTAEKDLKSMIDDRIYNFVMKNDFANGWSIGKNFQLNSIKYIVYTRCGIDIKGIDSSNMSCCSLFGGDFKSVESNILLPAKTILKEIEKSVREYENIIKDRVNEQTLQPETQQISEKNQESTQEKQPTRQRNSQPTQRNNTRNNNSHRRSYTNEEIQAARNTDLVDFLTRQGEQLKKVGTKEYTLFEHDSMRISGSKFYWNSQSFGGNAIDFCLKYYGMSFQEAVSRLLDYNSYSLDLQAQPVSKPKEEAKPKPPVKPIPNPLDTNRNRIIEYLTKTRGISPDIVYELIGNSKLAQDIMGNAVFKIFDTEGKLTGAEIVGTQPEKRFKELTEQKGNTFIFNPSNRYPTSAIFFESAIDAISYYNLHRDERSLLVSMAGLKQQAVLNVMDRYGIKAENCLISADNDDKGRNFMKKMKDEYNINSYPITVDGRFYSYENIKDWNDLLKVEAEKNRKLRNEFIKNYFDSNEIFAPNLASDEMTSVAEEFFNYDNSWHSVSSSIADIAARYRNGENVYESPDWVKAFGSSAFTQNIILAGDEKRANGFDLGFIEFTVETGDEGITFRYEDMEKSFSWEDFGKGQFNYIKSYFRNDIQNEYNYETQPVFNNYGEEPYDLWVDASEREKSEESLERLLKRIDGKELNLNPVGSFYELYGREAQTAAEVLGLKLSEKVIGGVKTPMVGFPNFALKENIKKLTDLGYIYNIKEDPSVISALEKYNPLYLKDNTDEQYVSNARRSVFKNNRIVSDNGNFKLIADKISPYAANDVVIVDLMNLSTAAIYISTENLEIDYSRSERENSAQIEPGKESVLSEDNNIFEYQGYHFKPVGNFLTKDDFNSLSRNIISHSSPYMSLYEDSETAYSRNEFYNASHNSTADVFLCVETGKIFTPGENMLFEFTGDYEPFPEIEKTVLPEEQQENTAETKAETVLSENGMPDISITADDRNKYGYTSDELLPLNTKKALELFDKGVPVYLLYNDDTEALADNRTEIERFDGIFGIEAVEWEKNLQSEQNIINTPSADKSSLPFAVGDSIVYADGNHERLWKVTDIENFTVTLSRKTGTFLHPNKETESFDLYANEDTIYVNLADVIEYFNEHNAKFAALKTALENHEPVYLIGSEEVLHNPRIEYTDSDGFRFAADYVYGGINKIHTRRLVNMDVMSVIKYIKDEEYRVDYSRLGLTKTVDLETEKDESEVSEKETFTSEYIYKMEANPKTTGRENLYFIQSYLTKEDGKADIGDILYVGTPEKCQEIMEQLKAGEIRREEVKELYAKEQSERETIVEQINSPAQEVMSDEENKPQGKELTELQKKSLEIFDKYKNLPLQNKIDIIAQAFGCKTGEIYTTPCTGKWRGSSDMSIRFDNGVSLFIGNHLTPKTKTVKIKTEFVDSSLKKYNPEIIKAAKEAALPLLLQREIKDNAVAAKKGLKPYTLLNVEFNDKVEKNFYGHLGWYYVTIAVDDKICTHLETGLYYDIKDGKVSADFRRKDYFTAGALKEESIDYVFNNVGFSIDSYSLPLRDDVRERAEKTLAERRAAESTQQKQKSVRKTGIIGNTTYRNIPKKRYRKFDVDTAEKIADAFEKAGLKYSGVVGESTTTLTFSGNDIEKAEAIIEQVKNNEAVKESNNTVENTSSTSDTPKSENTEKSSIHFGLMGNGITVYDVSKEKNNDYLTVAHISDEGVIKYYVNDLKESDRELIQKEADRQKAVFTEKWNSLSNETKYDRILSAADAGQLTQITSDMISMEEKVRKYEHSIIFKDEKFPTEYKVNIIGNTPYRNIRKKHYEKFDNVSEYSNPVVEKICTAFEEADIKYSGRITSGFTTLTFSKDDIEKAKPIIDSIANKQAEVDKKTENIEKEATPTITQEDIDSVLINGSGFKSGKYRIYRQFQKQEKSKVNADFLKKEYGTGSGTHNFPDGIQGWTNFDTKGISITKYGDYDNPDVKLNWSQAEKQIKKLISEDRYFTDEDNKKYPEFLKSVSAPQYEIDNFIKSVHQKFIQSKSKLPPNEKRDSLALRLSDFIRDLEGYEQGLLKDVGRTDLADISADEMEKHLSEPKTVQQLLDFLKNVQGATTDVYSRGNAWYFRQELLQLQPMQYVCKTDDIVYINSEKYEILEADNNNFILRNTEMALDTINLSFDELQKQLSGNTANDVYKRVITENSAQNIAQNQQINIASAPTAEQSQNKAANINVNSVLGQSFSQNIIDLFLQQGSNTDNARMVIATEFMKQKPIEEIAESLKTVYHGGFGIQAGNRAVSAWYDEDGIHLSAGKTARYNRNAQVISWTDAAERIGQLLNEGTFESNVELAEADGYEREQLAEKVLFLYRDISDEGKEQNLFSSLKTALSGISIGFPEQKSFLKEKLSDPEFRKALSVDFDVFKTAYNQDRNVLRFHYHKVDSIDRDLKELELPRIGFESDMIAVPAVNEFITDDEIDADLARGSGVEGGKGRIYNYFTKNHTLQEKADYIKNEYGIGGHSHALSGSIGSDQWHDSKGINYKKKNCKDVKMSWSQAAKRISEIIEKNEYLSKEAKNLPKEKPDKEQEISIDQSLKNNVSNDITEENSPDKGIDKAVQNKTESTPYIPIYKNTGKYAAENNEMDMFRASNKENRKCREAIENAIKENFNGMYLDPKAVDGVIDKFGTDRVSYLLAATIKAKKDYDKRFSNSNIKWADSIDTSFRSPDSFSEIINSHSAILDGFIRLFRESIEKNIELAKPDKEKTFEDIAEDVNKPVEYFTPTVKAVINDLSTPTYKRYNVRIWSSTDGKNYTDTGNGRYFNDLEMAKNFAAEIIDGKYDDIIAFTAKYDEIYKELEDNPEKLNEYRVNGNDFDEAVNKDSYKYYLKYISVRGDDFTGDRERTAFVLALNEISRQKYLGSEEKQEAEAIAEPVTDTHNEEIIGKPENFRITDYDFTSVKPRDKFRDNVNAIRTLFAVENENRQATPEEQEILSKYVGWGGLADAFDAGKYSWISEYNELKNLLPEKQYNSARASVTDSFYTPPVVISSIYRALKNVGFEGGRILEPSMGVGNFFGMLPEDLRENSRLYGVEIDDISGRIAKLLYPNANIQIKGFEDTSFNSNSFDLAVGNVPFGNIRITDKDFKERNLIHDYFFKKSLDRVRPGGVVAFITSKGTLDKKDSSVRKYLAERADLIGAIRLPDNVFKRNAGTEVTSDIIFLQKREFPRDLEKEPLPDWVNVSANLAGIEMNSYFIENPQMVLGEMQEVSGRFGTRVICSPYENADLSELLDEAVSHIKKIEPNEIIDEVTVENTDISQNDIITENTAGNETVTENQNLVDDNSNKATAENKDNEELPTVFEDEDFENEVDPIGHRNFCYDIVDGKIYFRENDKMKKQDLKSFHTKDAFERLSGMIEISKCLQKLIRFQLENYEDDFIVKQQKQLNKLYDDFTAKYGLLSSRSNKNIFKDDDTAPLLQSLENLNEKGELESKADIFTKRTIIPYTEITSVDTASEALAVSISEKAKVDLDFMSELCSKPKEEIASELEGVIFENPFTKKYETADEYLSGNVRKKLADTEKYVREFKEQAEKYRSNIEALKKVQPVDLLPSEIFVQLGSTWVPTKYYEEFMYSLLKTPSTCKSTNISFWSKDPFISSGRNSSRSIIAIDYNEYSATYAISNKSSFYADSDNVLANKTYGTDRKNAYQILEDSLNMKTVKIFDYYEDKNGKKKAVLNPKETILAQNKQNLIKSKFKEWIFDDAKRTKELCRIYNDKFNCDNPRQYNGEHINFVGMNPEITLREHQRNAIAHTLYGGNTLLAHVVGSGKTFEMVASAMESKRLGLCHKSLIAVPKAIVNQFAKEFMQLYPAANILVPGENDFSEKNRRRFCSRIATGNYDAIIISHNQLEKIPLSKERQIEYIQNQIDEIVINLELLKRQKGERGFTVKELESTKKKLKNKLKELNNDDRRDTTITFEELGVDKLYVDEAHLHKNLFFTSKMGRNVSGINTASNSQRATDLQMKCQYLDEITGSRGVVFATGTPVSNSIAELFTMQRYLQNDKLKELHIDNFDSWASTYAETKMALELAPEGKGYQMKTRFARFSNLPELMNMFKEVADVKTGDVLNLPVPEAHFHTISAEASQHQKDMVDDLAKRAEKIRNRLVDPTTDNMLAVTNDGRKLALDQRLMNPLLPDEPNSKINMCVENVFKIWQEEAENKSTQIIFSDLSTPNTTGFNVYDDIKKKLIDKGIPKEQIAFIHDCKTDVQKQNLFTKVNNGEVRVLLGSTSKLGTGVNCQRRLKAAHHVDCPWKPADLSQRNGRIIRQGNLNKEVDVYNYVTKSTFDSYLFQIIENKQRFISQIMTSKSPARSAEDVDESVLNYAQIKAIAAGDPRIQEKMNLDIEVAKLHTLFGEWQKEKRDMQNFIMTTYPAKQKEYTEMINAIDADITVAEKTKSSTEFTGMTVSGKLYSDKKEAGQALLTLMSIVSDSEERVVGEYRGFKASLKFDSFSHEFNMILRNNSAFTFPLGNDIYGNITRIDNAINSLDNKRSTYVEKLEALEKNAANTKAEIDKPFSRLDELHEKEQRLEKLNVELTMKNNDTDAPEKSNSETKDKIDIPIKTNIPVKSEKHKEYAYR